MDEPPKCSHDLDPIPQNLTTKDQSDTPKNQLATTKDQPTTSKDEYTTTKKDESTTTKTRKKSLKLQSLSKDQPATSKDQSATLKTESTKTKNQNESPIDEPSATKDEPATSIDQSATEKNEFTIMKTLNSSQKGESASSKNESVSVKDDTASLKYQVAIPISSTSVRRPPGIVDSGLSFCVARVASTTLSYGINSSYLNSYAPLIIRPSAQSPITSQPQISQLPSPASVVLRTQPQSLFLQALSKLNESSLTLSVINHLRILHSNTNLSKVVNFDLKSGDITPPDSLTSAPPSYSFVLRQMAVRRRPRLMGTFFPSPSFVQHTPPPTYTTAFDVYIEPVAPPPPARVYTFGFTSMAVVCPECGYTGMTVVTSRITICTHLCAFILCLLCCWICAPLPYVLRSCKDVYHYCRNCRSFLGMYCPTNPDSTYP